jgi:hypothetical protein
MTPAQQWTMNRSFLDDAIATSGPFQLATPVNEIRPGSVYKSEEDYLLSKGYVFSSDGTQLISPRWGSK